MPTRGVAINGFSFGLINRTTGQPVTSGTVTGYITQDGGNQDAMVNSPSYEGNGQWTVDITANEMDAVVVGLVFSHDDAITVYHTLITTPAADSSSSSGSGSSSGGSSGSGLIDVETAVNTPKRVRTEEGTVEERPIQELIEADRYLAGRGAADAAPWGIRAARTRPGGPGGVQR